MSSPESSPQPSIQRGSALALGCALLWAIPAAAVIPSADKIADAVAETNRLSGREEPLLLEVSLMIGSGSEAAANGVLASHPTGLARLELRSRDGLVERHLLQGNLYTASREGRPLPRPRPYLPPVFLLQATSGAALRAALTSYGVASGEVALGRLGDHDCYVIGGRLSPTGSAKARMLPSLWVDIESYEIVQIDRMDGSRVRFGPTVEFGSIRSPRWIEVEFRGEPIARLVVDRLAPANAPAAAFGVDWLSLPANP